LTSGRRLTSIRSLQMRPRLPLTRMELSIVPPRLSLSASWCTRHTGVSEVRS
jgi:hypothetical protein